jgi:hypothetical protein
VANKNGVLIRKVKLHQQFGLVILVRNPANHDGCVQGRQAPELFPLYGFAPSIFDNPGFHIRIRFEQIYDLWPFFGFLESTKVNGKAGERTEFLVEWLKSGYFCPLLKNLCLYPPNTIRPK